MLRPYTRIAAPAAEDSITPPRSPEAKRKAAKTKSSVQRSDRMQSGAMLEAAAICVYTNTEIRIETL